MNRPLSFFAHVSLAASAALLSIACCSGVDGDGITEAACDVILSAGCDRPASQNECFESYIIRNQDCCGQEYAALMNCFAASAWFCEGDEAVTESCGYELSELNGCEGDHPLCAHPPSGRPVSCD